jgi:serine/threonine-protein kinase HipA
MNTSVLRVLLQQPDGEWQLVGRLRNRDEKNWFEFDDDYWLRADRPILGQVFEDHGRAWVPRAHVALPRWFSHLLPEGMLRDAVARAADVKPNREFQLISRLGRHDLPGAVRITSDDSDAHERPVPPAEAAEHSVDDDPVLKFSLAGAQLKFSVVHDQRGLTVPASSEAGDYIVKCPDSRPGHAGVPQAEFAGLELARKVGISTPAAHLVDPADVRGLGPWAQQAGENALAIARFDRRDPHRRIHMEEIAQIVDIPTSREGVKYRYTNYETVALLYAALSGEAVVGEVIDRIVLNVLFGNGDAHLKNWAVLYPDGMHAEISPIYDVVPTVLYVPGDNLGLNLDGSKSFEAVNPFSFSRMGLRTGFGAENAALRAQDAARRVLEHWEILAETLDTRQYVALTDRLSTLGLPG